VERGGKLQINHLRDFDELKVIEKTFCSGKN
jgi:hypothetical protein